MPELQLDDKHARASTPVSHGIQQYWGAVSLNFHDVHRARVRSAAECLFWFFLCFADFLSVDHIDLYPYLKKMSVSE